MITHHANEVINDVINKPIDNQPLQYEAGTLNNRVVNKRKSISFLYLKDLKYLINIDSFSTKDRTLDRLFRCVQSYTTYAPQTIPNQTP